MTGYEGRVTATTGPRLPFGRRYRLWVRLHKHWNDPHPWRQAWHDARGPKRPMDQDDIASFAAYMFVVGGCAGCGIGFVLAGFLIAGWHL